MIEDERRHFDRQMMMVALRLAERGLGNVAPNPAVGAVIVDEPSREIIARGWTQPGGRPHAETEAIRRAGPRARGATLYVTLEPCSHFGKTPPCADAIVEAGVARVVCAIEDPDPRVAGRGLDRLRSAGIEVTPRILAREADWITKGHILRVSERRPLVIVKMAMSAAGEVPRGSDGRPVWVTGQAARTHSHLLRASVDAILIGRGTLEDDDPELTCRLPGMLRASPRPIVLAGRALPAPRGRLFARAHESEPWILAARTTTFADSERQALASLGCKVIPVTDVNGRIWIPALLEELVSAGVTRLLVEGGPQVWRSFFEAGVVDAVAQYVAGEGESRNAEAAAAAGLANFADRQAFMLMEQRQLCEDRLFLYRRARVDRPRESGS